MDMAYVKSISFKDFFMVFIQDVGWHTLSIVMAKLNFTLTADHKVTLLGTVLFLEWMWHEEDGLSVNIIPRRFFLFLQILFKGLQEFWEDCFFSHSLDFFFPVWKLWSAERIDFPWLM